MHCGLAQNDGHLPGDGDVAKDVKQSIPRRIRVERCREDGDDRLEGAGAYFAFFTFGLLRSGEDWLGGTALEHCTRSNV